MVVSWGRDRIVYTRYWPITAVSESKSAPMTHAGTDPLRPLVARMLRDPSERCLNHDGAPVCGPDRGCADAVHVAGLVLVCERDDVGRANQTFK